MKQTSKQQESGHWTDRFGAVASTVCAIHCGVCALLPWAFGALGLGFLVGHEVEWALTLIAVAFGGFASVVGWRRHGSPVVVTVLVLGIVGLLLARGLEMGEGHHGEHEAEHHAEKAHVEEKADGHDDKERDEHADEKHADEKHGDEEHGEHGGMSHAIGGLVGVLGGLLLVSGHILNIQATRRREEAGD